MAVSAAMPLSAGAQEIGGIYSDHAWEIDPWVLVPIGIAGLLYARGGWHLRHRRAAGDATTLLREICYWMGWFTLVGALVSPIHLLAEGSFAFHMVEHELLMVIAAPLIVLARPVGLLLWGLPVSLRRWIARGMQSAFARRSWAMASHGTCATLLHGVAIWVWHIPAFFGAAASDVSVHRWQHLSFFLTALIFWWPIVWGTQRGASIAHLFLTMLHTGILGALIAFSPRILYVGQSSVLSICGLPRLEDQQLGGMIMWIPCGTIYAGAAIGLAAAWIANASRSTENVRSS